MGDEPALRSFARCRRRRTGPRSVARRRHRHACAAVYDRLDGILVPGGVDIDPAVYREPRHELLGRLDPARDVTELTITRWALEDQKPFLGLCRGLQVLSVALGGTLWQDITNERPDSEKHDYFPNAGFARDHLAHHVDVQGDSRLGEALGPGTIAVNSMHHQGIRDLGARLVPTAIGSDGLIEGAELEGARFRRWRAVAPGDVRVRHAASGKTL